MEKYIKVKIPDGKYCTECDYISGDENHIKCVLFPGEFPRKSDLLDWDGNAIYIKCNECLEA